MSFTAAITKLDKDITAYTQKPTEPLRMQLELRIDDCARKILTSKADDKEAALNALVELRGKLVRNTSTYPKRLYLNLIQNIGPTPFCPYYKKYQAPTISTYQIIGSNLSTIRLDPSSVEHVPAEITKKLGNLSDKSLDIFSITVDGRFVVNHPSGYCGLDPFRDKNLINLCTHSWSHPHLIQPHEAQADTNMGVFPVVGFEKASDGGAIAFNDLSPMNVHSHDDKYSPDNAHFNIIPDSPYGIFWAVTQKDNRVAISKMVVLFDFEHSVCEAILNSIGECPDATTHAERLKNVQKAQDEIFDPIIENFKNNDEKAAMDAFNKLPDAFRYGVYEHTWKLLEEPMGIHGDFGRVSFQADGSLDPKYHCTNLQRAQAITNFHEKLDRELVGSQVAMLHNQRIAKGDNVRKMMKCAQLFNEGLSDEADKLFESFTPKEKEAVYFAMWEVSGCQLIYNIGTLTFHDKTTPLQQKAEALLLAASRQEHVYDKPLAPPISSSVLTLNEEIQQNLENLLTDPNFAKLSNSEKAAKVNALLQTLDDPIRQNIYQTVYESSTSLPTTGVANWGELHVADNADLLRLAFAIATTK